MYVFNLKWIVFKQFFNCNLHIRQKKTLEIVRERNGIYVLKKYININWNDYNFLLRSFTESATRLMYFILLFLHIHT